MAAIPARRPRRRQPDTPIRLEGGGVVATLGEFWAWSGSNLLGSATRGVLAEYLVALALGRAGGVRTTEWEPGDVRTASGIAVEVKSAAFLHPWAQARPSRIGFDIRPRRSWSEAAQRSSGIPARCADVYVFALLGHLQKESIDPLDLARWRFWALSARTLDSEFRGRSRLSLAALKRSGAVECRFDGIAGAVEREGRDRGTGSGATPGTSR